MLVVFSINAIQYIIIVQKDRCLIFQEDQNIEHCFDDSPKESCGVVGVYSPDFEVAQTLFYALLIALFIRTFFFQPFYIPSSSMEPNLLIGDRLFVSKYSYGYSRHSFPFSPKIFSGRILKKKPKRGDVIVFKTPADNRTDYIKRLIGLPGDKVQIIDKDL